VKTRPVNYGPGMTFDPTRVVTSCSGNSLDTVRRCPIVEVVVGEKVVMDDMDFVGTGTPKEMEHLCVCVCVVVYVCVYGVYVCAYAVCV
jgi:hypothetical protein